jgi:hypothetical protein
MRRSRTSAKNSWKYSAPAILATDVLYVGLGLRMPETYRGHHAGQLAANEPVHAIGVSPLDKALPAACPYLGLRGRREVKVRFLNHQPSARARLDGLGHPRQYLRGVLGDLMQQCAARD